MYKPRLNMLLLVAVIVTAVTFILELLSTALPYWLMVDMGGSDIYYGLWEVCASVNGDDYVCRLFSHAGVDMEAWQEAVCALMVMALFFVFFALILAIIALTCLPQIILLHFIGGAMAVFAGLLNFIGVVVYGAKYDDDNNLDGDNLHAGFYLAIFAMIFAVVSGILIFISKPKYTSQID